ncbi:MAG: hypothetical protein KGL39_22785 [Patescibacteria group bacterium]|nr:hypothetical protein [Patescibacteria group bacterium]
MASLLRKRVDLDLLQLANALIVSHEALQSLSAAYCAEKKAWAFPMTGKDGKWCGVRLRNAEGFKWAVSGSSNGVFLPDTEPQPIAYLPEGPTDTAACLTLGLFAIGRPSCNTGVEELKSNLARLGIRKVVIISDNDNLKRIGNREGRPGIEGALRLKKELRMLSVVWMPPGKIKDVREFLKRGGTRQLIENEISKKPWTK